MAAVPPAEPVAYVDPAASPAHVSAAARRRGRKVARNWTIAGIAAAMLVVSWATPSDTREIDTRLDALRYHQQHPHWASERVDDALLPALRMALDGGEVDGSEMVFFGNSFIGAQTEPPGSPGTLTPATALRNAIARDFAPAVDPVFALTFEWDDTLIAAIDPSGRTITDRDALERLVDSDIADRMRAAEDDTRDDVRTTITTLKWARAVRVAGTWFQPVGLFLLFLSALLAMLLDVPQALDPAKPATTAGGPTMSGAAQGEVADHEADTG